MGQPELLAEAINLTLFGMCFVFLFLTLLVFVTKIMSIIVQRLYKNHNGSFQQDVSDEVDERTKHIIEQAIKMHRGS